MHRNQFDMAEGHTKRALSYARQYSVEGDLKTTLLLRALSSYYGIRMCRGDPAGGLIFAEEAYNCAAIAYNPVHPEVQVFWFFGFFGFFMNEKICKKMNFIFC
jgi:hypothetical protein